MSDADRYAEIAGIVADALEADGSERSAIIEKRCAGDAALRSRVLKLLAVESDLEGDHPFADDRIDDHRALADRILDSTSDVPSSIGKYRVIRELGRGGMSVVYECEQDSPSRRVAVKLMDTRFKSLALNRRLRLEAEILAKLRHECIATVYEAGVTAPGEGSRPYFAMELVDGVSLTEFAEREALDTRQRLELLARVADGVEHAHQKGVIHRDLKPGNILVTDAGVPKILDFGIARVTHSDVHTTTLHTTVGAILGTIAYMSPEQASGDEAELGTQADVYSLGVIGYELLAGELPLRLEDRPIYDAIRMIRDENPTMLSSLAVRWRGDIETLIHKALEKDPQRRYASAGAFAEDVRRYLSHQPIAARPPSTLYQLQKFSKRNRALVGGTLATILVLIVGTVVSATLAVSERHQRRLADERELTARENSVRASFGLLSGAQQFADAGDPWAAAGLLDAVPKPDRGWAWRHLSMRTPWLVPVLQNEHLGAEKQLMTVHLLNDSELVAHSYAGEIAIVDAGSGELRTVVESGESTPAIKRPFKLANIERNQAWFVDANADFRVFDSEKETFDTIGFELAEGISPLKAHVGMSNDFSAVSLHAHNNPMMRICESDGEHFSIDSELNQTGMQWEPETYFLSTKPYVIVSRWGGQVCVLDRELQQEVARIDRSVGIHVGFGVLPDESAMYISTPDGIELRSIPDLKLMDTFATEFGPGVHLGITTDGRYVSVSYPEEQLLRIFETDSWRVVQERDTQVGYFTAKPIFAPGGRLLQTQSPDAIHKWLIDPERPEMSSITTLDSDDSWIYQIALSPDGSLLASAAPEGYVLLWDLTSGSVIARLKRKRHTSFNMDAPLAFSGDGGTLYFAELRSDPESELSHRLEEVNLATGERSSTMLAGRLATLDALSLRIDQTRPGALYHHAARLQDGRIVLGSAHSFSSFGVRVRPVGGETEMVPDIRGGNATTGVAVSPDGSTVATGEYRVIRVRDAGTMQVLHEIYDGRSDNFTGKTWGVTYSPDGALLAVGTEGGRIMVYDTEFYQKICDLNMPKVSPDAERNYIFSLLWTPDGSRLITTTSRHIRILETERHIVRERRAREWSGQLEAAYEALAAGSDRPETVTQAAWRVAQIERWAGDDSSPMASAEGQ